MNLSCHDRDRVFLDGSAEEWAALEQHAAHCPVCAEEIRAWQALSQAGGELRDYRDDPALWAKIEASLQHNQGRRERTLGFWERLGFGGPAALSWRAALVGALVVVLAVAGVYVIRPPSPPVAAGPARLLKSSALAEVQRTERDYMKAIDQLAAEAKPELDSPTTPLMASYKEKLIVLDSAIDELRVETWHNPSNAHLRYELLAMYQEKQQTLQEVLETKR